MKPITSLQPTSHINTSYTGEKEETSTFKGRSVQIAKGEKTHALGEEKSLRPQALQPSSPASAAMARGASFFGGNKTPPFLKKLPDYQNFGFQDVVQRLFHGQQPDNTPDGLEEYLMEVNVKQQKALLDTLNRDIHVMELTTPQQCQETLEHIEQQLQEEGKTQEQWQQEVAELTQQTKSMQGTSQTHGMALDKLERNMQKNENTMKECETQLQDIKQNLSEFDGEILKLSQEEAQKFIHDKEKGLQNEETYVKNLFHKKKPKHKEFKQNLQNINTLKARENTLEKRVKRFNQTFFARFLPLDKWATQTAECKEQRTGLQAQNHTIREGFRTPLKNEFLQLEKNQEGLALINQEQEITKKYADTQEDLQKQQGQKQQLQSEHQLLTKLDHAQERQGLFGKQEEIQKQLELLNTDTGKEQVLKDAQDLPALKAMSNALSEEPTFFRKMGSAVGTDRYNLSPEPTLSEESETMEVPNISESEYDQREQEIFRLAEEAGIDLKTLVSRAKISPATLMLYDVRTLAKLAKIKNIDIGKIQQESKLEDLQGKTLEKPFEFPESLKIGLRMRRARAANPDLWLSLYRGFQDKDIDVDISSPEHFADAVGIERESDDPQNLLKQLQIDEKYNPHAPSIIKKGRAFFREVLEQEFVLKDRHVKISEDLPKRHR